MDHRGVLLNIFLALVCLCTFLKAQEAQPPCETECGGRCCPHENGVCCEGGSMCCQQGQTCLSNINTCIGLNSTTRGNVSIHSVEATPVAGIKCPSGTTPCEGGCCPYADAVCCGDGTCCPSGFTCTPDACVKDETPNKSLKKDLAAKDPEVTVMGRKLKKLGIQICPDKLHLCPGTAECCQKDNGQWDCCPKVSNLKGDCCVQFDIFYVCCPDEAPTCYWNGCWFS